MFEFSEATLRDNSMSEDKFETIEQVDEQREGWRIGCQPASTAWRIRVPDAEWLRRIGTESDA